VRGEGRGFKRLACCSRCASNAAAWLRRCAVAPWTRSPSAMLSSAAIKPSTTAWRAMSSRAMTSMSPRACGVLLVTYHLMLIISTPTTDLNITCVSPRAD